MVRATTTLAIASAMHQLVTTAVLGACIFLRATTTAVPQSTMPQLVISAAFLFCQLVVQTRALAITMLAPSLTMDRVTTRALAAWTANGRATTMQATPSAMDRRVTTRALAACTA